MTQCEDHDLVGEDEFVLRRIHRNHCSRDLPRIIHFATFRPSREDTRGLSVFREQYVSAAQVAASGRKPGEYFVARLSVKELSELGLTVVPDADASGLPGHAVIPELACAEYEQDKPRLKDVLLELSRLASQAIVHEPESEYDEHVGRSCT
jgi:hypothetical protein